MEMMLDFNINGEVLIPFYNSSSLFQKPDSLSVKDIYNCNFSNFRNVLFQGELIKLYILLRPDNMETSRIKPFLESLFFKIELESTGLGIGDNSQKEKSLETTNDDLFTINTEKIDEKNYEYDNVTNKFYDEETKTEIYEVYKQIIVPKNFLGVQLIMKLQILTKNEDMVEFTENSDTFLYYKTGHFTNEDKFKTLKTLFKEVKVIKPFSISDTKKTDLTMDMSLLQIKIENITGENTYEDVSLKNSRFLKKGEENKEEKNENKKSLMTNFVIDEIEILEDETSVDEKETEKIDFVKKYLMKKNSLMQKSMNFKLIENNFPVKIKSGEDYMLSVRVNKNCFLTDSDIKNNTDENTLDNSLQLENSLQRDSVKSQGNALKEKEKEPEKETTTSQQLNTQPDQKPRKKVNFNTNAITITKKSVINKMQERHGLLNNRLLTESPMPLPDIYQKSLGNKQLSKGVGINEVNRTETNTLFSYHDINEENIKIYYITPVLLYISCDMFYENLFLCLQLKWYQELNRLLKIEMQIPENIYLYDYFEVSVKIRNISSKPMNLLIETKDDESEMVLNKVNNFEYMPGIISQIKFQSLGMFNCNEDKIFKLKFLATKFGFTYLPNFSINDTLSNLRIYIVQTNKIFIQNNKDLNRQNPLNHLISKTI
jgi:hypothetical protein